MSMAEFIGKSNNGNFDEALEDAIKKALAGLQTEAIDWKLLETYGNRGGFLQLNDLYVKIEAEQPQKG